MYYLFPSVLCFDLPIYVRPGQECTNCDQIAANKNAGTFITLSDFLSLGRFKMFIISISSI